MITKLVSWKNVIHPKSAILNVLLTTIIEEKIQRISSGVVIVQRAIVEHMSASTRSARPRRKQLRDHRRRVYIATMLLYTDRHNHFAENYQRYQCCLLYLLPTY